jgi:hypothetical protein
MKNTLFALAALAAFSVPALAEKNVCNDPRLTENYQGDCVPSFGMASPGSGQLLGSVTRDQSDVINSGNKRLVDRFSSPLDDLKGTSGQ